MQQRAQTGGRARAYVFLGLSVIAAAIAAAIVWQLIGHLQKQAEDAQAPGEMVDVVVAARDLNMGVALTQDDVVVRSLPVSVVVEGATFDSLEQVVGEIPRTPKERILANEIIRRERLALPGEGVGLNALITEGQRAMAVQISQAQAVAAFIQPGNYVDVIVVIRPDERNAEAKAVSKVLLQGKRVLAVGATLQGNGPEKDDDQASRNAKKKPVVTIEVDLEEAEQLALAASRGDIHLVLRADVDVIGEDEETEGATASVLIGVDPKEKNTPAAYYVQPKVEGPKVEVISGKDRGTLTFDESGAAKEENKRRR
jgi:pilus assembly protein CpaB